MLFDNPAPILRLPANRHGNDYVVGDLHGCLTLLQRLLEEVEFDFERDRLFSVGDLIDRGPDSAGCLQLLSQPWFYAVQGNHELMLLDFFEAYRSGQPINRLDENDVGGFLWNGGEWVERYYHAEQKAMSEQFDEWLEMTARLPLLIIVGEGDRRFHVIHAELAKPPFRDSDPIWLDSDIDDWLNENAMPAVAHECVLWARALIGKAQHRDMAPFHQGLSTTFCGHSFDSQPRLQLSHINLDTGAFLSSSVRTYWQDSNFGLTLYDVTEGRWHQVSYQHDQLISGQLQAAKLNRCTTMLASEQ